MKAPTKDNKGCLPNGLSLAKEKFCRNMVTGMESGKAYRDAFGSAATKASVRMLAYRLLCKRDIKLRIHQLNEDLAGRFLDDQEAIIKENNRVALADPRKLFSEDGTLLPPKDWPDDIAAAVAAVDVVQIGSGEGEAPMYVKKVRMHPKVPAIEIAHKRLGLFERDNLQKSTGIFDGLPRAEKVKLVEKLQGIIRSYQDKEIADASAISGSAAPGNGGSDPRRVDGGEYRENGAPRVIN